MNVSEKSDYIVGMTGTIGLAGLKNTTSITQRSINVRTQDLVNGHSKIFWCSVHCTSRIRVLRFHVVDPMHNLLLGTGKHALSVWIKLEIIRPCQYDEIQQIIDTFSFPSDIGRITYTVVSSFSGFTADQWRTWIMILSPIILKEILPPLHYRC